MRSRLTSYIAIVVVGLLLVAGAAEAQDFAKVGTAGAKFLEIPIGSRGVAMGSAYNSVSNDMTAMFWNPAGLVHSNNTNVMVERVNWFADISYNIVGVSHSINEFWAVGFYGAAMGSGDIDVTTVEQQNGTGETYSVTNVVAGVSVATRLTDKFSIGGVLKYVREDLDTEVSNSWAVDLGTMYDTNWRTVRLSMAIRNFGPEIQLDGGFYDYVNGQQQSTQTEWLEYSYPLSFRMGLAADPLSTPTQRLTVSAELEHPSDNIERINLGGEYAFQEMFFLRGGYTFRHDTLGLSAGLGVKWSTFSIDYAYSHYGVLEGVHRFGIQFGF